MIVRARKKAAAGVQKTYGANLRVLSCHKEKEKVRYVSH